MKTTLFVLATGSLASAQLTRLYSIPPEHGGDGADPTNSLTVLPPGRGPVGPIGTISGGMPADSTVAPGVSGTEAISHPNGGFLTTMPGPASISMSRSNASGSMASTATGAASNGGSGAATTQAPTGSSAGSGSGSAASGSASGSAAAAASSTAAANPAAAPTGIAGGLAAVVALVGVAVAL